LDLLFSLLFSIFYSIIDPISLNLYNPRYCHGE
jgi:hypothetical protein